MWCSGMLTISAFIESNTLGNLLVSFLARTVSMRVSVPLFFFHRAKASLSVAPPDVPVSMVGDTSPCLSGAGLSGKM